MSATVADAPGRPLRYTGTRDKKLFTIGVIFGAASIGSTPEQSDTGITLTRTGVGLFTLTFPPTPGRANVDFCLFSPAATVGSIQILTKNNATGTWTFRTETKTAAPGTGVDPATSDELDIQVWADSQGDA